MKIKVKSLFTDGKGNLFTVDQIENYKYRGETKTKIHYYPISDSGLMHTTKRYNCNLDKFDNKYKLLNWRF